MKAWAFVMRGFRVIALGLGLTLLFASLMKYLAITKAAISPELISTDWWLSLGSLAFESILGLWLLSGLFPNTARWLATGCFWCFAVVSFFRGIRGDESCGCLGALKIDPWIMFGFDAVAAVILFATKPEYVAVTTSRLWRFVTLAGIFALGAGIGLHAYESVTSLSRGLLISERTFEFGKVSQSEHLTHVFTIENHCRFAVEIAQSSSTCACTTIPDMNGTILLIGDSLELPVTLATGDSEEHVVGGVKLFCRKAGSSSPPYLLARLQVSAKVDPDYVVRPLVIDFGTVSGDSAESREVRIRPNRIPAVSVLDCKCSHPAFRATATTRSSTECDEIVEVTFNGRGLTKSAKLETPIVVETSSSRRPQFRILARVSFRSELEIEPAAIVVGSDVTGEVTREIEIQTALAVEVTNATATGGIKVATMPVHSDGKRWRLSVAIPEVRYSDLDQEVAFVVKGLARERNIVVPVYRFSTFARETRP